MNLEQFEQLLKDHDWSYMMSDDSRYYRRGQMQWFDISDAMKQGGESFEKLYLEYRDKFGV